MDFLNEYKSVMEKHAGLKVFVGVHRKGGQCCIDYGNHSYMRFWYDHGVYCFDIEERGEVQKGGDVQFSFGRVDAESDAELHGVDLATCSRV